MIFTKLYSVGSAISVDGYVCPVMEDGGVDILNTTNVADCSDEWWASLSEGDLATVDSFGFRQLPGEGVS